LNIYTKELVILSKIDKDLDSYTPQIEAINSKVKKAEDKLSDLTLKRESLVELVNSNKDKIGAFELQIKELKEQLDNIKKKSKLLKNEKEIMALSSEEHIAKDSLEYANEEINRLNSVNEVKEAELAELEEEISKVQAELNEVRESVTSEYATIEDSKKSLYQKREEQVISMDPKILSFYEEIRKWAGNTAVVKVENQACYGCYMKINDKAYSDLIKGEEIVTCPHCGRVLYLEVDNETAEA